MTELSKENPEMPVPGSVSRLLMNVAHGSESATTQLWAVVRPKLLRIAKKRLIRAPNRMTDEEDAVGRAFLSFIRRAQAGSYRHINNRTDLWRLLNRITTNKAINQIRVERCRDAKSLNNDSRGSSTFSWDIPSDVPSPESNAVISELVAKLYRRLKDDELRQILTAKLHGFSNDEIATKLNRSLPTIERRVRLIREICRDELEC